MKSRKTVHLTILTILVYGSYSFLQHRKVIFPFPINDWVMLVIPAYLVYLEPKISRSVVLLSGFVLFSFLQNIYNFEFFLNQQQLKSLNEGILLDIFQLLTLVLFFAELLRIYLSERKHKQLFLIYISLLFFISSIFVEDLYFQSLQFLSFSLIYVFYLLKNRSMDEIGKIYFFEGFWLLMSFLKLTLILTYYLLG